MIHLVQIIPMILWQQYRLSLCIKVSATPKEFNGSIDVEVKIEDVIEAGFIKKVIELQKDLIKKDDDSIENILLSAIKKKNELEECYKAINIRYMPLCLQINSRKNLWQVFWITTSI